MARGLSFRFPFASFFNSKDPKGLPLVARGLAFLVARGLVSGFHLLWTLTQKGPRSSLQLLVAWFSWSSVTWLSGFRSFGSLIQNVAKVLPWSSVAWVSWLPVTSGLGSFVRSGLNFRFPFASFLNSRGTQELSLVAHGLGFLVECSLVSGFRLFHSSMQESPHGFPWSLVAWFSWCPVA